LVSTAPSPKNKASTLVASQRGHQRVTMSHQWFGWIVYYLPILHFNHIFKPVIMGWLTGRPLIIIFSNEILINF
jgi:hypothetical protein